MAADTSRPQPPASEREAAWECVWCGASLSPIGGVWTDEVTRSGDYCSEGLAVGRDGTSPHLPRAAHPTPPPPLDAIFDEMELGLDDVSHIGALIAKARALSPAATPSPDAGEPPVDVERVREVAVKFLRNWHLAARPSHTHDLVDDCDEVLFVRMREVLDDAIPGSWGESPESGT